MTRTLAKPSKGICTPCKPPSESVFCQPSITQHENEYGTGLSNHYNIIKIKWAWAIIKNNYKTSNEAHSLPVQQNMPERHSKYIQTRMLYFYYLKQFGLMKATSSQAQLVQHLTAE